MVRSVLCRWPSSLVMCRICGGVSADSIREQLWVRLTELLDVLEPERRTRREREAQEKSTREKTERLEREMAAHRQAAQAEAERF